MTLATFLHELWDTGRVSVPLAAPLSSEEIARAEVALAEHEREQRGNFPDSVPPFSPPAALWGATLLYRACQLLVDRTADAEQVRGALSTNASFALLPATHYSIDLSLRYLPDVARLARRANADDPLLAELATVGRQWPLASVGMPDTSPASLEGIVDDRCLLTIYADRIIATGDQTRLVDSRVATAVQWALGMHSQLAPGLAHALTTSAGQIP